MGGQGTPQCPLTNSTSATTGLTPRSLDCHMLLDLCAFAHSVSVTWNGLPEFLLVKILFSFIRLFVHSLVCSFNKPL